MKKQFDEFQKMKLKEMCKTIEDMTYTYINPETKNPTVVPAKHYENILNKTIEQFIEDSLKIEMMNNVFKQMNMLMTEYKQDLIKSLICMDKGLKPTDLSFAETIALNETYHYIDEKMNKACELAEKYRGRDSYSEIYKAIRKVSEPAAD